VREPSSGTKVGRWSGRRVAGDFLIFEPPACPAVAVGGSACAGDDGCCALAVLFRFRRVCLNTGPNRTVPRLSAKARRCHLPPCARRDAKQRVLVPKCPKVPKTPLSGVRAHTVHLGCAADHSDSVTHHPSLPPATEAAVRRARAPARQGGTERERATRRERESERVAAAAAAA